MQKNNKHHSLAKNWAFFTVDKPTAIDPIRLESRYQAPPNMKGVEGASDRRTIIRRAYLQLVYNCLENGGHFTITRQYL